MPSCQSKLNKSTITKNVYQLEALTLDPYFFPRAPVTTWHLGLHKHTHTRIGGESDSTMPAPSWKGGNEPEFCRFSQHPFTTCLPKNTAGRTERVCVWCTWALVLYPHLSATYVKLCAWWQRRRWRWWGRRAIRWTYRRNGSSSFPRSSPPRDSGGQNALHGHR